MRILLTLSFIALSFNSLSFANDGQKLVPAFEAAVDQYISNRDELLAWSMDFSGSDIKVKTLDANGDVDNFICNEQSLCEAIGSVDIGADLEVPYGVNFEYIFDAQTTALSKLEKSLKRKNISLSSVSKIKTWVDLKSENEHGVGSDIWTNIVHKLGERTMNIYVYCHIHGIDGYYCHYSKEGKNELSFE